MNDALRNEIITEITRAFANVRRGDVTLHEARVIDSCGSDKKRRAARSLDTESRWEDVPAAIIEAHPMILSYLCPESFRYYIAAYMVWSLRHYGSSCSDSLDFTIYALTPDTNKLQDKWKLERFSIFSPAQARATQRFLRFMIVEGDSYTDTYQAELALNVYWNEAAKAISEVPSIWSPAK